MNSIQTEINRVRGMMDWYGALASLTASSALQHFYREMADRYESQFIRLQSSI